MANHQSVIEDCQSAEPLGSLPFSDQLYNALHGIGDISHVAKTAVLMVMHDYYHPAEKIATEEHIESQQGYEIGRDEIIHVVNRCLESMPQSANAALSRWVNELKAEMKEKIAMAIREAD